MAEANPPTHTKAQAAVDGPLPARTHLLYDRLQEEEAVTADLQVEHDHRGLRQRLEVKLDLRQMPVSREEEISKGQDAYRYTSLPALYLHAAIMIKQLPAIAVAH